MGIFLTTVTIVAVCSCITLVDVTELEAMNELAEILVNTTLLPYSNHSAVETLSNQFSALSNKTLPLNVFRNSSVDLMSNRTVPMDVFGNATDGMIALDLRSFVSTYMESSILTVAIIFIYLRIGFLVKLVAMVTVVLLHFIVYNWQHLFYPKAFDHITYQLVTWCPLLFLILLFHILDRQGEYTARTDFLWQAKLKVEQDDVETMRGINKILLENILPAHVAQHFLHSSSDSRVTQVSTLRMRSINKIPFNLSKKSPVVLSKGL
uniref:Adenylate cyclase type 2 n=1 Tax=Cacopsylla melanoneura TaxID=428564 RepID=A0A8D9DS45_9HEMI